MRSELHVAGPNNAVVAFNVLWGTYMKALRQNKLRVESGTTFSRNAQRIRQAIFRSMFDQKWAIPQGTARYGPQQRSCRVHSPVGNYMKVLRQDNWKFESAGITFSRLHCKFDKRFSDQFLFTKSRQLPKDVRSELHVTDPNNAVVAFKVPWGTYMKALRQDKLRFESGTTFIRTAANSTSDFQIDF